MLRAKHEPMQKTEVASSSLNFGLITASQMGAAKRSRARFLLAWRSESFERALPPGMMRS
jgi:hypothetical protein